MPPPQFHRNLCKPTGVCGQKDVAPSARGNRCVSLHPFHDEAVERGAKHIAGRSIPLLHLHGGEGAPLDGRYLKGELS